MPAGAVADQDGVRAGLHLRADLMQMLIHRFGIGRGHDDRSADLTGRADRAKYIDGVVTIIPDRGRPRANRSPLVRKPPLLAHPGFVLKPYLQWLARRGSWQSFNRYAGKVFLKVSCAMASFFGWYGRGCNRVRLSRHSSLATLRLWTVTEK